MIALRQKTVLSLIGLALCLLFFSYFIGESQSFLPHDYANSYFGGYFFWRGEFDTSIFDPYAFNKKIHDAGIKDVFASYNPNPPSTALMFALPSLLPISLSKLLFTIITSLLFLLSIYRLCRHLQVEPGWIFILLPIVFAVPLRNQILFGQTYFLLIFLLIEGFIAYENKKLWLAAILWSIAIFLKIFPLIIILFLLVKKEWKAIGYLAITGLTILLICVLVQGMDIWIYYVTQVLPRSSAGEVTTSYEANFQSAQMFFKFLFVADPQLNPSALYDSKFVFSSLLILFNVVVISLCASFIIPLKSALSFGMIFLASILLLPYGNTYGNIILIILLIALSKELSTSLMIIVSLIVLLICNIPVGIFRDMSLVFQFPRFFFLIGLFLLVFFLVAPRIQWKFFLIWPLMMLPLFMRRDEPRDPSLLLVPEQKHSLVYNYHVQGNLIVYNYWTEHGENLFETNVTTKDNSAEDVEVKGNQIFFKGKQITFSSDNKSKPMVINGSQLIYLSDKDRGLGFYTLRVIELNSVYSINPPA